MSDFLCVRALKEKRLELSTPNLMELQCLADAGRALTLRSKGQGHMGYQMLHGMGMQVDVSD